MRHARRALVLAAVVWLGSAPVAAAAAFPELDAEVGALADDERRDLEAAFLEPQPLLEVEALVARPSAEAYRRMRDVVARRPRSAASQAYLAEAAFRAGDFEAAGRAWRQAVDLSGRAPWALGRLAAFHGARLEPARQLATIDELVAVLEGELGGRPPETEPTLRAELHRLHAEALAIGDAAALPGFDAARHRRAIVALHPDDPSHLGRWLEELVARRDGRLARAELERWRPRFPGEARTFARLEAGLLYEEGKPDAAIAHLRRLLASDPLAPDLEARHADLFLLLGRTARLAEARRALEARAGAGRLPTAALAEAVFLALHEGRPDDARGLLAAALRDPLPAASADVDLLVRGRLHARLGDVPGAVRLLHAAWVSARTPEVREAALVDLAGALVRDDAGLTALTPLDPLDAFARDRHDAGPSIVGGLASLVFQAPHARFDREAAARATRAYLNVVRADGLLARAEREHPRGARVPALALAVLGAHRAYGRHAAVVDVAERFVARWPGDPSALEVALAGASARRATGDRAASDKAYREALALAERRSRAEADRVFDAWTSVLLAERREVDIVALHWERIERRPRDAELLERLLSFLASTRLYEEERRIYERALARFPGAGWEHRLARWHLRHRGLESFRALTTQLAARLPGAELERLLGTLVAYDRRDVRSAEARFYEAVYRAAIARFPHRAGFVLRLCDLLEADPARLGEARALLLRHAPLDAEVRARLFRHLALARRWDETLAALAAPAGRPASRAETLVRAELLVWVSRQEEAAPLVAALVADWPHDADLARRAARLAAAAGGPGDRASAARAASFLDAMHRREPGEPAWLDEAGAYHAEAGDVAAARARWERMIAARPGDPATYVRLAAVYWDYYLFDESRRTIERARALSRDPLLFWDKVGGIHESGGDRGAAAHEYARAYAEAVTASLEGGGGRAWWAVHGSGEGDDEGGAPSPAAHLAEADPGALLLALRRKQGGEAAIERAFRALEAARQGDFRPAFARTRYLGASGDEAGRRLALREAIVRYGDPRFLEAAAADALAERWGDVAILALERRAVGGGRAPAVVYPLVDALERHGRPTDAEAELRGLVARLERGGADARPGVVDARVRLADFLARQGRDDASLAERALAAAAATGAVRDAILLDLAWRALERGAEGRAEAIFVELRRRDPRDPRALEGLAGVVARRGDPAALRALYDGAIVDARALPGATSEERRDLIASIRLAYAARLEAAGRHAEAIDQWIEVVNRDPRVDRDGADDHLAAAIDVARRRGVLDRLRAYYRKTAEASPQDVRWQVAVARIERAAGRHAEAAAWLDRALAVRPDRLDLLDRRGAALLAAGDAAAAARVYETLYERSDEDVAWLVPRAEAHLRMGAAGRRPLVATLETYVARAEELGAYRFERSAELLARAGLEEEALGHLRRGLAMVADAPLEEELPERLPARSLELALGLGRVREVAGELEAARAKIAEAARKDPERAWRGAAARDALDDALTDGLLELVAIRALDGDALEIWPLVVAAAERQPDDRAARLAARASGLGRPDLAIALIDARRRSPRTPGGWGRGAWDGLLVTTLREAGADRELLARFDGEASLRVPALLPVMAGAARRLGDRGAELRALGLHWDALGAGARTNAAYAIGHEDPLVARTLELIRAGGDRQGLERLAGRGATASGRVASWLLLAGETELGVRAIEAAADRYRLPAVWRSSRLALALAAVGERGDRVHRAFQAALGRRPIGELLARPAGRADALRGRPAFGLAWRYATDVLAGVDRPPVRLEDYAHAGVEDRPLAGAEQLRLGELYLGRKDAQRARRRFELAIVLEPRSRAALDGLARAHLAAGERAAALAAWDRVRAEGGDDAHLAHATYLRRAGLAPEARAALRARLEARLAALGAGDGPPLVRALAEAYPAAERGAGGPLDRVLRGLVARARAPWLIETVLGDAPGAIVEDDEGGHGLRGADVEEDDDGANGAHGLAWGPPAAPRAGLLEARALAPYYRDRIAAALAAGRGRDAARWQLGLLEHLVATGDLAAAAQMADGLLEVERARTGDAATAPMWLVLASAEAHAARGDVARAAALLDRRLARTASPHELTRATAVLDRRGRREAAARLTVRFYETHAAGSLVGPEELLALAGAQLELGDEAGAIATLERSLTGEPERDVDHLRRAAELLEAKGRPARARAVRERLRAATPNDPENRLRLALDLARIGERAAALREATGLLGDRRAPRAVRLEAARLVGEVARHAPDLAAEGARLVEARLAASPPDEATLVALAGARRARGDGAGAEAALGRASREARAPAVARLELGLARLAAGDAAGAIPHLEAASVLSRGSAEARRALFAARRAAGNHAGAVAALEPPLLEMFRRAGARPEAAEARRRAVVAAAADRARPDGPLARVRLADAADSAVRAADPLAAAFYLLVAAEAEPEPAREGARTAARRWLADAAVLEERATRRLVSFAEEF